MKNNILKSVFILLVSSMLFLPQCSKNGDETLPDEPVPIELNSTQVALVGSGNSFAFDIFRYVIQSAGQAENVIISPLSISYALSMTVNGANGETRDSILKVLKVNGITPDEINSSYRDLTKALLSVDKRVLMTIANSVWTENDFIVKKSFMDILTNYYDADSRSFDINDTDAPKKINAWIEDKTNGLIKNMVEKLNDNTLMLLINAIYFKGKWNSEFDPDETLQKPFYKSGGSSVQVPMMRQKSDFKIYQGDGFIMGEFPYGQGNFVMDIILPDANDGVAGLLPSINDASFTAWTKQMTEHETNLSLPRFNYGYKKQLKDILSGMGMKIAFYDGADFTNIASFPPLIINDVTHQAFIETNEEGTEAAAATIVDIGFTSYNPASPINFNVNHTFLYMIREITTNSVIFMGRVSDPLAE
jgi:serine protease inhibitor